MASDIIKINVNNNYTEAVSMFKVENEFKGANISRTIRFTEKLFEGLNKIAAENEISFNLLVLQCCKYAVDNIGNDEGQTIE